MTRPKSIPALSGLSPRAKRLHADVLAGYVLEPHQEALFLEALASLDRADQCRAVIGTALTIEGRFGELKPHPLLTVEVAARSQFGTLMRQLGLDLEAVDAQKQTARARAARWSA